MSKVIKVLRDMDETVSKIGEEGLNALMDIGAYSTCLMEILHPSEETAKFITTLEHSEIISRAVRNRFI